MPREYKVYLEDILAAIKKIQNYTQKASYDKFKADSLLVDAVVRNLEVIGEAAKALPKVLKTKNKTVEWKKISGLRDILIHQYFGVDLEVLWDIIINKLPDLKKKISVIK